MKKYLVDTSVWIDYFSDKNTDLNDRIDGFIDENIIYINGIIIAELLFGAKNEKDFNDIKNYLDGLNYLETDRNLYDKTAYNGYILKTKGITVPLSDLIIATQCSMSNIIIIERDKHYKLIENILNIERYLKY